MKDLPALGRITILALITVAVAGYLLVSGKRAACILVLVSLGGGALLSNLFKYAFARERPDFIVHSVNVSTASFPSSHAMLSAVTCLTLGALLARVAADPLADSVPARGEFASVRVRLASRPRARASRPATGVGKSSWKQGSYGPKDGSKLMD